MTKKTTNPKPILLEVTYIARMNLFMARPDQTAGKVKVPEKVQFIPKAKRILGLRTGQIFATDSFEDSGKGWMIAGEELHQIADEHGQPLEITSDMSTTQKAYIAHFKENLNK